MFYMKKVTAGKDALGEFAPLFARLNDDVLFGEVWSREEALSPKIRSILTVAALTVEGVFDSSVEFHMRKAKENGVSGAEIAEILTHLAFYAGWPKAWAAFRLAKNIWTEKESGAEALAARSLFPIGKPNMAYENILRGAVIRKSFRAAIFKLSTSPSSRRAETIGTYTRRKKAEDSCCCA